MAGQKQDDQLEHAFNSYVKIRDVALEDLPEAMSERRSGISVLATRQDDDDCHSHEDYKPCSTKIPSSPDTLQVLLTGFCFYGLEHSL